MHVPQLGVFIVSITSLPLLLFCGFYLRLQDMPACLQWVSYVTFFRHGFEAIMQCVYGYDRSNLKCSEAYCHYKSPKKYLEEFGMEEVHYWNDILGLLLWIITLQLAFHFMLKLKMRISR